MLCCFRYPVNDRVHTSLQALLGQNFVAVVRKLSVANTGKCPKEISQLQLIPERNADFLQRRAEGQKGPQPSLQGTSIRELLSKGYVISGGH